VRFRVDGQRDPVQYRCSIGRMPAPHGTISRYNNARCRCDACRAAIREYRREQRTYHAQEASAPIPKRSTPAAPVLKGNTNRPVRSRARPPFQVVRASCGHLLWFLADEQVPAGRWASCPYHPTTGVGRAIRVDAIPLDAYRGMLLDDPQPHLPAAFRPVPAQQPADLTPAWARPYAR
jgi:hypothetical protein